MPTTEHNAEIAEVLATFCPHVRRVEAMAKRTSGPAKAALDRYVAAALEAQIALKREKLGVGHG